MKKINTYYWIFTGLLAAMMLMSAITNIMVVPQAVEMMGKHLGYPVYLIPFLGVAKLLGVIAILVPGFSRIKEWAYAGFVFDLSGALYSTIAVGDKVSTWLPMLLCFALVGGSYYFYHKRKTLRMQNVGSYNTGDLHLSGVTV
jgi:uncharacterized membrane protein YphA (DoxX/SURF4 family)